MKTIASLLIAILALNAGGFARQANEQGQGPRTQQEEVRQAAKIKGKIQKRGIGKQSQVRVELRDGAEIRGYISKIDDDSFEVSNPKTGKVVPISYADVARVRGPGLSKTADIVLGAALVTGIVLVLFWALYPKT